MQPRSSRPMLGAHDERVGRVGSSCGEDPGRRCAVTAYTVFCREHWPVYSRFATAVTGSTPRRVRRRAGRPGAGWGPVVCGVAERVTFRLRLDAPDGRPRTPSNGGNPSPVRGSSYRRGGRFGPASPARMLRRRRRPRHGPVVRRLRAAAQHGAEEHRPPQSGSAYARVGCRLTCGGVRRSVSRQFRGKLAPNAFRSLVAAGSPGADSPPSM